MAKSYRYIKINLKIIYFDPTFYVFILNETLLNSKGVLAFPDGCQCVLRFPKQSDR